LIGRSIVLGIVLACLPSCVLFYFCFPDPEPLPTIDGPEDLALLDHLEGSIVVTDLHPSTSLLLIDLSTAETVQLTTELPVVMASGLSSRGELAYISDATRRSIFEWPKHQVRIVSVATGAERTFPLPAEPDPFYRELALDPTGRHIVLAWETSPPTPGGDCEWNLEVFDVDGTHLRSLRSDASMLHPRWSADGTLLAFNTRCRGVVVWSVELGTERVLAGRRDPLFASGSALLVRTADDGYEIIQSLDIPGRRVPPPPGLLWEILGLLRDGLVVYHGLPTTGTPIEMLSRYTFVGPGSKWSLKVAGLDRAGFATVVAYVVHGYYRYSPAAVPR